MTILQENSLDFIAEGILTEVGFFWAIIIFKLPLGLSLCIKTKLLKKEFISFFESFQGFFNVIGILIYELRDITSVV